MNRRSFVQFAGAGAVGAVTESVVSAQQRRAPAPSSSAPKKALMKVGTQHGDSDAILRVMAGFGVNNICSRLPSAKMDEKGPSTASRGCATASSRLASPLDIVPLPMSSNDISRFELPNIMLGKSPERDREIDDVCALIAQSRLNSQNVCTRRLFHRLLMPLWM